MLFGLQELYVYQNADVLEGMQTPRHHVQQGYLHQLPASNPQHRKVFTSINVRIVSIPGMCYSFI